jgi:hypothetical protein
MATKKALADIGAGGSAGSAPNMSNTTSAPVQPQTQGPQVTQLNQSSINALGNQAFRAYVVEQDVTTSQGRMAAIKARARFE